MEININDNTRTIEVWLTNNEACDMNLRDSLKPIYEEYKKRKYTVAVFGSGAGDLFQETAMLVLSNNKQIPII